ncbi:two-component system histidine kinase PnpS [Paenibacillus sp.]|uniref:two-component system histidine kinase PnpS n=1 Tax=Paenibacillus sp. TaxID=58172 RepID=UPI0028114342|nr:ATP-binding protein [Paenibacillus sp.]
MLKFRHRLTLIFIFFIGLSNIAAGIFTISVMRDSQIHALEEGLEERLEMYLATVDWDYVSENSVGGEMFRKEATRMARKTGARVTFFDEDGVALGDSGGAGAPAGDGLPPEIARAKGGAPGVHIRREPSAEAQTMYVAMPASFGKAGVGYVRFGESMQPLDAETRRIASYLGLGLIVILMVTALIAYRMSLSLTGPIEKMTRVAYQITNMNYRARIAIPNKDEIGQLGHAINKMSESLQYQMNQIQEDESRLKSVLDNMTSGVVMVDREGKVVLLNRSAEEFLGFSSAELLGQRYTLTKTQQELTRMIAECFQRREPLRGEVVFHYPEERTLDIHAVPMTIAEDAYAGILVVMHDITAIRRLERMRSEFVANVSHELKTPIAAVKGFAETLLGGAASDPATTKSFLQIIYDESERLNRLIGDILDLSKIESKRVPLQFSPVEMKTFVERIFHMMATEAKKKGIALEAAVDQDVYIEADEDRLQQILVNLLSNGITYSHDGGRLRVLVDPILEDAARPDEYERVRITVQDYGVGIPKKDLPRIFERFYRVDKARTRVSGGTGLGLSIVKHLVELHKGTIRVESELGMGTRFIIELPVLQ